MLQSLSVKNYALINSSEINFHQGFSVITGETGAGKSILLDALSLILGQRADLNALKNKEKKCIIEGVFDIKNYALNDFFQQYDLDYEHETILRREITPSGKSRAFINDTAVNLNILKELSAQLIDIHSQHNNMNLNDFQYQLTVVDSLAKHQETLDQYKNEYRAYKKIQEKLKLLRVQNDKAKADFDYFLFLFDELESAKLQTDEQQGLEQELEALNHSEEIQTALSKSHFLFSENEQSILGQLKENLNALLQINNVYPKAKELANRLESSYLEIQDIASEIDILHETTESNPDRLFEINERLNLIYHLQQKHKVASISELQKIHQELNYKISNIHSFEENLNQLKKELEQQTKKLNEQASFLFENREKVIPEIEQYIESQLVQLGMPYARFQVALEHTESFMDSGKDKVRFLFSANNKNDLHEISRIASGGEISRLMLSIKSLLSKSTALPTIIFDEIDTGVSGEIADKMGNIMKSMANNMQVIDITHLPQIAAKGDYHYFVFKENTDSTSDSKIKQLNKQERTEAIARMLSGENITKAALSNARELLKGRKS